MIPANEALERLRSGNARFVSGRLDLDGALVQSRRSELTGGQAPFAIVLGCSDSRVPVEILFDQALGDLFVIRVAGNIVAPSLIGSAEFAATKLGTRLVVVLGHSQCGAIAATLEDLREPSPDLSPNLGSIVGRVRPAVETVMNEAPGASDDDIIERAVRANVMASVEQLRRESDILTRLARDEGLAIVGARYSLESGAVEFFPDA